MRYILKDEIYIGEYFLINIVDENEDKAIDWLIKQVGVKKENQDKFYLDILSGISSCNSALIEMENQKKEKRYAIFLKEFNWTVKDFSDLNHELFHLVFSVFTNFIDTRIDESTNEPAAYYLGYISEQVYNALGPKKKKK